MTKKILGVSAIAVVLLAGLNGCNSCRPRLCKGRLFKRFHKAPAQPVTAAPLPPGSQFPGPPPGSAISSQPPAAAPFPGQPGVPQINGGSGGQVIPPPVVPGPSQYGPTGPKQVDYRWVPGETPTQKPAPLPPKTKEPPSATLIPPIFPPEKKKPDQPELKQPEKEKPKEPKESNKKPVSDFPVGIPQYSPVREGIASGLRPLLDDGLDWLQKSGFKTILHVRKPGAPDAGDQQQVEKRGMKYIAIEVSPDKMTKEIVEQFNKTVSDQDARPLFVYDHDGSLAGGLWYLYFRTHEQASDEVARIGASNVGFHENQPGSHQDMWKAIQAYMSK